MHRAHELRLIRARPAPVREKAAKVIALRAREVARIERIRGPIGPERPEAA